MYMNCKRKELFYLFVCLWASSCEKQTLVKGHRLARARLTGATVVLEGAAYSGPKLFASNAGGVSKEAIVRRIETRGTAGRIRRLDTVDNGRQLFVARGTCQTTETAAASGSANMMGSLVGAEFLQFSTRLDGDQRGHEAETQANGSKLHETHFSSMGKHFGFVYFVRPLVFQISKARLDLTVE